MGVKEAWRQEPPPSTPHPRNGLGSFLEQVWAQTLGQGNGDERDSEEREGTQSKDHRREEVPGSRRCYSAATLFPSQPFLGTSYLN